MKVFVALFGEPGGGKGSCIKAMPEYLPGVTIEVVRSSRILEETLGIWGIDFKRPECAKLVESMETAFKNPLGVLTNAVRLEVEQVASKADVVVFDGARLMTDYFYVTGIRPHKVVYITAPQRLRYERVLQRREKAGEGELKWEEFCQHELAFNEVLVPVIGRRADFTINNDCTFEQSYAQVREFCRTLPL